MVTTKIIKRLSHKIYMTCESGQTCFSLSSAFGKTNPMVLE